MPSAAAWRLLEVPAASPEEWLCALPSYDPAAVDPAAAGQAAELLRSRKRGLPGRDDDSDDDDDDEDADEQFRQLVAELERAPPAAELSALLFRAVALNAPDVVAELLRRGADPNCRAAAELGDLAGATPLLAAAAHDAVDAAVPLLAAGADPNAAQARGGAAPRPAAVGPDTPLRAGGRRDGRGCRAGARRAGIPIAPARPRR